MKASYNRRDSDIFLSITVNKEYRDSYKLHMLQENSMSGIIPYAVEKKDEGCMYSYKVTGMTSMKNKFLGKGVKKEDMEAFIHSLNEASLEAKKYMLDTDELLLYPELIFYDKDKWRFCYFPYKGRKFEDNFLRIKEFFVKRIDNSDMDAIMFSHKLYKATLTRPYSSESLMKLIEDSQLYEEKQNAVIHEKNSIEIIHGGITYGDEDRNIRMVCERADDKSLLGHYLRRKERKDTSKENDDKILKEPRDRKKLWGNWDNR